MMHRIVTWGVGVGIMLGVGSLALAADKPASKPAPVAPAAVAAEKSGPGDELKKEIGALQLQGMTVQILAMEYQKELGALQRMQTTFCETNKLDVEKFRQGKYRYDDKESKFVEREPAPAPATTP